jgi:hypothetical protein
MSRYGYCCRLAFNRAEIVDEKSRPAEKLTQGVEKQIPSTTLHILNSETPASRFASVHTDCRH